MNSKGKHAQIQVGTDGEPLISPPFHFRRGLDQLERFLDSGSSAWHELKDIAPPETLKLIFEVELAFLLRGGPDRIGDGNLSPAGLLRVAQAGVEIGALAMDVPDKLRRTFEDLKHRLHLAGAWASPAPLWWEPLPEHDHLENVWRELTRDADAVAPPPTDLMHERFAENKKSPHWLTWRGLLPDVLTRRIYNELEACHHAGELSLERAGVGAKAQISFHRSDYVRYLTGNEADILKHAPYTAGLIHWNLTVLEKQLRESFPDKRLVAPERAMLTRYPAPSGGYDPHVDNPSGELDNGRAFTVVMYLNPPEEACQGGEIVLWEAGKSPTDEPNASLPAHSGAAVMFDARRICHQVREIHKGPARWALTLWFNDHERAQKAPPPEPPALTVSQVLAAIPNPSLPKDTVLFHRLEQDTPEVKVTVHQTGKPAPRIGIVTTIYRGGRNLDAWCDHHLMIGADHLILVFDHPDDPREAEDMARLRARYNPSSISILSGPTLATQRWPALPDHPHVRELLPIAQAGGTSHAVAARQALYASVVLKGAHEGEYGGTPLDWLVHLDGDELLYPENAGHGGESLKTHFQAADDAGLHVIRYANHELLPATASDVTPCFKLNPRLAAAKLGEMGWLGLVQQLHMDQQDKRPYFMGYHNGKSAVSVPHGLLAGGVHGWLLKAGPKENVQCFLAGPSVLHFHNASGPAFRDKYLAKAKTPPPPTTLFQASPLETRTLALIKTLVDAGSGLSEIGARLETLYLELTTFSNKERHLLDAAGLLLRPNLSHPLRFT